MNRLRGFFAFLYDFVVGDDPLVALAVVLGLGATAAIAGADAASWWVLPCVVVAVLAVSVQRATRR